jgi:hypothetical protein
MLRVTIIPKACPNRLEDQTLAMLKNLVSVARNPIAKLQHVHAVHGSKYYGHQLGPGAHTAHGGKRRAQRIATSISSRKISCAN